MNVRIVESIEDFKRALGLSQSGVLLESDLDVVEADTDAHGRKRRDAEGLLAKSVHSRKDESPSGSGVRINNRSLFDTPHKKFLNV